MNGDGSCFKQLSGWLAGWLDGWMSYWAAGLSVLHDPDATSKGGRLK